MTTADCLQRALLTKTHTKPARTFHQVADAAVMWACSVAGAFVAVMLIVEHMQ